MNKNVLILSLLLGLGLGSATAALQPTQPNKSAPLPERPPDKVQRA